VKFKDRVKTLRNEAAGLLEAVGIHDRFVVKVRPIPEGCLGLYRGGSQFRGKPIFWINSNLPKLASEEGVTDRFDEMVLDTILHEYGHVIYEFAEHHSKFPWNCSAKKLWDTIQSLNDGPSFYEAFAENMVRYLKGSTSNSTYVSLVKQFAKCLEE